MKKYNKRSKGGGGQVLKKEIGGEGESMGEGKNMPKLSSSYEKLADSL